MNLKVLNTLQLDSRIKFLVAKERVVLHEVLLAIKEIDCRRSYLEMGYANLYAYLTEGVGYSAASAQRRIEAVRMIRDVPEIAHKIQSGEISLNQISLVQKACRQVQKNSEIKVSATEKKEVLESIVKLDHKTAQVQVAQYFDIPVVEGTVHKIQANESVRVELTLSKELHDKIRKAQALLSHAVADNDLVSYLEYVTERIIKQKTSVRQAKGSSLEVNASNLETKSAVENECSGTKIFTSAGNESVRQSAAPKNFSQRSRKVIFNQQQCCQFIDPITKKQCGSEWFLQVDHLQPRWDHGNNTHGNAQILCGAHNRMKYQKESGRRLKS